MERRFLVTVDGHPYNVTVQELTDHGGPQGLAALSAMKPAAPEGGPALPATPPSNPAASAAAPTEGSAGTPGDVLATLGGVVQSVAVTVGQPVQQGEVVVVLESMKMNSPMVAARSGRVTQLCVKVGEPVHAGQLLAVIG